MKNDRSGLDTNTSWPDVQLSLISVTPGVDGGLVYRRCSSLLMENTVDDSLMWQMIYWHICTIVHAIITKVSIYLVLSDFCSQHGAIPRSLNMGSEMFSKWKPLALKEGFTILPVIVHPRSRGTVSLRRVPSLPLALTVQKFNWIFQHSDPVIPQLLR